MIDNFNIWDYFGWKARLGRKSFALRMLFAYIISFALLFLMLSLDLDKPGPLFAVLLIVGIINTIFIYANILRRLHDLDKGKMWAGILFFLTHNAVKPPASNILTILHLIGIIFLICKKGSAGENKYGPPPQ